MNISSAATAALFAIVFAVLFAASVFIGTISVPAVGFVFGSVSLLGIIATVVAFAVESKQSCR